MGKIHDFGDKYEVKLRQIRDKAQKAQDKTEQLEEKTPEWIVNAIIHKTLRVVETHMRMRIARANAHVHGAGRDGRDGQAGREEASEMAPHLSVLESHVEEAVRGVCEREKR